MVVVLIFGAAAGATLGLRSFSVFLLIPLIVVTAFGTMAVGVATGHGYGVILLNVLGAIMLPQLCYLAVLFAREHQRPIGPPTLSREVQMAIGEELRAVYRIPPDDLPPEIVELLERVP